MMKKFLCVLLALCLLLGLTACKPEEDKTLKPLTPVGFYEEGVSGFSQIQSELYDYFLSQPGFGYLTFSAENGTFADNEMIQYAIVQLSYAGEDVENGMTKRDLERTATRLAGSRPTRLEGMYLTYDKDKDLYFPQNLSGDYRQMMALQSLTVNEDATCVAVFDRAPWDFDEYPEDEETTKQNFLNGLYEGNGDCHRIRMTYRERDTTAFGYYIEVLSIEQVIQ